MISAAYRQLLLYPGLSVRVLGYEGEKDDGPCPEGADILVKDIHYRGSHSRQLNLHQL